MTNTNLLDLNKENPPVLRYASESIEYLGFFIWIRHYHRNLLRVFDQIQGA